MREFKRWPKRHAWSWHSTTDFGPGSEGHRKNRWHFDAWTSQLFGFSGTKRWIFEPKFGFKVSMTRELGGTYAIRIRRGWWNRLEVSIEVPGFFIHGRYYWPTWEESLEDFAQDMELVDRKEAAFQKYKQGIGCQNGALSMYEFTTNLAQLIQPAPMWVNGQVSVVKPVLGCYCTRCHDRHGIWPGELADLLNTRSIRDTRDMAAEAERERTAGQKLYAELMAKTGGIA